MRRFVFLIAVCVSWSGTTRAQGVTQGDDTWSYASRGELAVDAGLALGDPAAPPTGMGKGVGAGVDLGRALSWGLRAAWLTSSESSLVWNVTHDDLQLRLTGGLRARVGRGSFGLRLGLGGTLVHESRERSQGSRAGLSGGELSSSSWKMLPALDLDAVVALHIAGAWLMVLSAGPSAALFEGSARAGWNAHVGAAWQP